MFKSNDSFQKETLNSIQEELSLNAASIGIKPKKRIITEKELFQFDERKTKIVHPVAMKIKMNIFKYLKKSRLKLRSVLKFNKHSYNDPILFI